MSQTTPEETTLISPASETDATTYTRPAKRSHVPAGMHKLIFVGIGLLLALLAVVLIFSHKMSPTKSHSQASKRTATQQQTAATTGVMPADENDAQSVQMATDPDSITPNGILATKNGMEAQKRHAKEAETKANVKSTGTGQGAAGGAAVKLSQQLNVQPKAIGSIAPFQPPAYNGVIPPGQPSSNHQYFTSSSESIRVWNEEVTKTRIIFSRKSVPAASDATRYLGPAITSFGLEPGFRVAARLEASATTSVAAPVTAVIEYNYERDGRIVLPAGSRAIGRINSADARGNVAMSFDSIDLPNGSTVPISAVGVDTNLRLLKGQVSGSSRGKAMLVATLSGIGQTTAMMLGNNTSGALSGQDMMRAQLSQNMGNTADAQIAKMISNEKIVVTLAAGTEFYMVFTKAAVPQNTAQQSGLAANSSQQLIPPSLSGR